MMSRGGGGAPLADQIERQIIEIIAKKKKLDPAAVTTASTFDELAIDSLDAADLIFTIEDTFKVIVSDEAAQSMRSVGEVVAGVRLLIGGGSTLAEAQ
jgi:acyl carrier protein